MVEDRTREIFFARDQILEEAQKDHQALLEQVCSSLHSLLAMTSGQIHIAADRKISSLTRDLETLMRDVQQIHDFTDNLHPVSTLPAVASSLLRCPFRENRRIRLKSGRCYHAMTSLAYSVNR